MDIAHVVSFSGGKDSTALVEMMIDAGMQIDEIINIDTMMEFDQMYEHIKLFEKHINIPITTLSFDFEYYMYDHVKRDGTKGYKWCGRMCRWGTTLKKQIRV